MENEIVESSMMYCENGECRVESYHPRNPDGSPNKNCPGCGQMGRKKGKQ